MANVVGGRTAISFTQAEQACNRTFLGAAMAASALLACAKGRVSFAKRSAVPEILKTILTRKAIDVGAADILFGGFTSGILNQPERGRARALKAISGVAGDPEDAELLIRVCCAISQCDGNPSSYELAVIEEISTTLNVSVPNSFRANFVSPDSKNRRPLFITIGNEKGGTGKSTTAMILAVSLLDLGYTVGSIDLDGRQGTLSRYLTNRRALAEAMDQHIPTPIHQRITGSEASDRNEVISQDMAWLASSLNHLWNRCFDAIASKMVSTWRVIPLGPR